MQSPFRDENVIDLSVALLINGNSLEPQPERCIAPEERKFKTEKEFTDLITTNTGLLFGKNTLLIDATKSLLECYVLIDYNESENHILHLVDISLSKQNFWETFARISKLFTILTSADYTAQFAKVLGSVIAESKELTDEIITLSGYEEQEVKEGKEQEDADIEEYLRQLLYNKPFIMLISDQERLELDEMRRTYPTNWGKCTVSIVMQKYVDEQTFNYLQLLVHYSLSQFIPSFCKINSCKSAIFSEEHLIHINLK